jgi:hypothetical protein
VFWSSPDVLEPETRVESRQRSRQSEGSGRLRRGTRGGSCVSGKAVEHCKWICKGEKIRRWRLNGKRRLQDVDWNSKSRRWQKLRSSNRVAEEAHIGLCGAGHAIARHWKLCVERPRPIAAAAPSRDRTGRTGNDGIQEGCKSARMQGPFGPLDLTRDLSGPRRGKLN